MDPSRILIEVQAHSAPFFCSPRRRATAQPRVSEPQDRRSPTASGSQHRQFSGHSHCRQRLTVSSSAAKDRVSQSTDARGSTQDRVFPDVQSEPISHSQRDSISGSEEPSPPSLPPPEDEDSGGSSQTDIIKWLAPAAALGGLALMGGAGYLYKDQIKVLLGVFIEAVDDWGPLGYFAFGGVYTLLELAIIPAIPLTMTAGVLFGALPGLAVVSASGTLAATISFLIARYAARDKVLELAKGNKSFAAIDRAIGKDSFKVVLLLRLSPLLPLAASNYLYGLTSVALVPYILGSWLGMLPGTLAYVSAGSYGRALLDTGESGGFGVELWQVAVGAAVTLLALGYVGNVAKKALDEADVDVTL